ncbi:hypothetical protein K227x_12730 [Rubripirellula lacrimiformis]|uniref:Uncharacterized protein n=1 Tax=Rubripirellula lacrimiformis TaxID=1930273 RepID=A0A517N6W9_9BACT|nr:tetratricopeptide repeat protein [Rubripirellula lacrimiformis]QDT02894.1 hypothetical protein K227x_12730 [Rubripirellula lacrimiformis]
MNQFSKFLCICLGIASSISMASVASAQSDRLYDTSGKNISGTVAQTSSKGVQIKRGSNTETFLAADIEKILYEGDPGALTQAREFAIDGQYEQAIEELKKVDPKTIKRKIIAADYAYYNALCNGKLALAGRQPKDAAAKMVIGFIGEYRDSWHLFDAAKLLGDLALALGNYSEATKYYKYMEQAASPDTKIESVYLQAMVAVRQDQNDAAIAMFDKIIDLSAQTPQTLRTKDLSKAGKAVALAQSGKADAGLKLVNELIDDLNPSDIEMGARIYNAQGACFEVAGDDEGSVLAYLHTHLMFSGQPDAHAEALLRLVELWPQLGKPERAAEARQELQQRYPGAL